MNLYGCRESMVLEGEVRHVVESQNHLGEGPIWHPDKECLYWVDLFKNKILKWSPLNPDITETITLDHMVSSIGLRKEGFILATNEGFAYSNTRGEIEKWCPFTEPLQPGAHANDGAVDRHGRFWAGTAAGALAQNHLYRLDADQSVHTMETDVGISNGIAWSPDDRTMYYVDSPKRVIYAYDFDAESGSIANRRILVHTPESDDTPDGITVDSEGYIWCARWDGWRLVRYTPYGTVDTEIELPVQRPTSCTFGGKNLKTLFITSARTGLSQCQLKRQPLAGGVFAVDLTVSGIREAFVFS